MKKLISAFILLPVVLTAAGCSAEEVSSSDNNSESGSQMIWSDSQSETAQENKPETDTTVSETDSLVVYFSWSGNTRHVAESIQQQTGSDIFGIAYLEEPYLPHRIVGAIDHNPADGVMLLDEKK